MKIFTNIVLVLLLGVVSGDEHCMSETDETSLIQVANAVELGSRRSEYDSSLENFDVRSLSDASEQKHVHEWGSRRRGTEEASQQVEDKIQESQDHAKEAISDAFAPKEDSHKDEAARTVAAGKAVEKDDKASLKEEAKRLDDISTELRKDIDGVKEHDEKQQVAGEVAQEKEDAAKKAETKVGRDEAKEKAEEHTAEEKKKENEEAQQKMVDGEASLSKSQKIAAGAAAATAVAAGVVTAKMATEKADEKAAEKADALAKKDDEKAEEAKEAAVSKDWYPSAELKHAAESAHKAGSAAEHAAKKHEEE